MSRYFLAATTLIASAALAAPATRDAAATSAEPAVDAQWAEHHVDFSFFGHTVGQHIYYDCDVVESKLERLLLMAGARKDLKVRAYGCNFGQERVSSFIQADLDFKSPSLKAQPISTKTGEAPLHAAAQWKPVAVKLGWTTGFDPGDCLLVDQFRVQVLQHLELRNLTANLPCSVQTLPSRGRTSLGFEALTATGTAEEESIQTEHAPKKHDDQLKSDQT